MAYASIKENSLLEVNEILINENGPKNNPWECHFFKHQIKTSTNEYFISTVSWSVDTNIPLNLSIDDNGMISGQVLPLTTDQPGITETDFTTKEPLKEDGSNWKNIGRFSEPYKDFKFDVYWTIKEYETNSEIKTVKNDPDKKYGEIIDIEEITDTNDPYYQSNQDAESEDEKVKIVTLKLTGSYIIRVIKNNDIDNVIFCIEYLKAGWTLNLGNKKYDKTMINQYLQDNAHLTKWDCWKGE
jgi:hypothetical protein